MTRTWPPCPTAAIARRPVDLEAGVVAADDVRLARVEAHPDADRVAAATVVGRERALGRDRRRGSPPRPTGTRRSARHPRCRTPTPPAARAASSTSRVSCASSSIQATSPTAARRCVEPSMSVNRNVTTPDGRARSCGSAGLGGRAGLDLRLGARLLPADPAGRVADARREGQRRALGPQPVHVGRAQQLRGVGPRQLLEPPLDEAGERGAGARLEPDRRTPGAAPRARGRRRRPRRAARSSRSRVIAESSPAASNSRRPSRRSGTGHRRAGRASAARTPAGGATTPPGSGPDRRR